MFKSFSALAAFAFLGASVIALPALALKIEVGESAAFAKGDRLQTRVAALNCDNEVWPQETARCLRSGKGLKIVEARLVPLRTRP
jgi:hypothetical protein